MHRRVAFDKPTSSPTDSAAVQRCSPLADRTGTVARPAANPANPDPAANDGTCDSVTVHRPVAPAHPLDAPCGNIYLPGGTGSGGARAEEPGPQAALRPQRMRCQRTVRFSTRSEWRPSATAGPSPSSATRRALHDTADQSARRSGSAGLLSGACRD